MNKGDNMISTFEEFEEKLKEQNNHINKLRGSLLMLDAIQKDCLECLEKIHEQNIEYIKAMQDKNREEMEKDNLIKKEVIG